MDVANPALRGVMKAEMPACLNTRAGFSAGQNPMSTKDSSTESSIGNMDTLNALLLEAVDEARRQGYDHNDVAQRFANHSETLREQQYTPYTPHLVTYPTNK